MREEKTQYIQKKQIIKSTLDHKKKRLEIFLSQEKLYDLEQVEYLKEPYRKILPETYDVVINYHDKYDQLPNEIICNGLIYLLKKSHNSLAKDIKVKDIQVNESEISIKVSNRMLHDKLQQNNTMLKMQQEFLAIYGVKLSPTVKYESVEINMDLSKELDKIVRETVVPIEKHQKKSTSPQKSSADEVIIGKPIDESNTHAIDKIEEIEGSICCIKGEILNIQIKSIRNDLYLSQMDMTDYTNSVTIKSFVRTEEKIGKFKQLEKGNHILAKGKVVFDSFSKEYVVMANHITKGVGAPTAKDTFPQKRVELHVHSKMSVLDGISDFDKIVKRAKEWGHDAIALTDHGVLQGFPEAMNSANKHSMKVLYGMEGYLCDDNVTAVKNPISWEFDKEFIVFDLETTGLSPIRDKIIEVGAVKIRNKRIVETFNALVDPEIEIPFKITQITGITNHDVRGCKKINEVIADFLEFMGSTYVLCAHNAAFDFGFMKNYLHQPNDYCVVDTLELSRYLLKKRKSYRLNKLCKDLGISLENHHRAADDAQATGELLLKLISILEDRGVRSVEKINDSLEDTSSFKSARTYHILLLVKDKIGLKNLYRLVSESHLKYFYKKPLLPKSLLNKHREGLILGTACESGELYTSILQGSTEEALSDIVDFYDFLEIQPLCNNRHLLRKGLLKDEQDLININKKIVELGEKHNKPVCATGDVHFLDKRDGITREILMSGQGYEDAEDQPSIYFKSTDEMIREFSYLGDKKCKEVVITNPRFIADKIEAIEPLPQGTYPPIIEGSDDDLRRITLTNAYGKYGDPLPEIVEKRLMRELDSIINNGYAVMYIIAQKLVEKSMENGYLVGSRGSVGSSFAATMSHITEVNPLPPHYLCGNCKNSEFIVDGSYGSGVDLPDKDCPKCGGKYHKDGHDIPFEVFLGFEGDKEPDIDLNFAAVAQVEAMKYTEELFGEGYVYRAGTIGTIASKTAYGFVKNYFDEKEIRLRTAEINRLVDACTGIKRTTGQHPGGVMIVPKTKEITDFTPVQYPANKKESGVITTHFDYHSISGRILKLDILGHDTPTIIRMLEEMTEFRSENIPLDDEKTLSLFESPTALHLTPEDIDCQTGSLGIPEFGTGFVRQMLLETKPQRFSDLVRISGLSHGTDVWIGNAQDYIKKGQATIKNVISTRDDIMTYLIYQGVAKKQAFDIMERVRKGKGLREEDVAAMKEKNVPQWYIDSCNKIKYMFPKAHAVAYVMMSVKIAYYKVHYPLAFYASYFTMKNMDFDATLVLKGVSHIKSVINEIEQKEIKTQKDKNSLTVLEVTREMLQRGFDFLPVDLYQSDYKQFRISGDKLLPPLVSLEGLGENAALNIQKERVKSPFISIEDMMKRAKINKTCIEVLKEHGCLDGLDQSNQISLFNI